MDELVMLICLNTLMMAYKHEGVTFYKEIANDDIGWIFGMIY